MPKTLDELYPKKAGEFLKAEDLKKALTLKISGVEIQEMKDNEEKLVLSFENEEKKLVVNQTNAGSLAEKFTKNYEKWTGETITIGSVSVSFGGKPTKGIRIIG